MRIHVLVFMPLVLLASNSAFAADKMKINIVEETAMIGLVPHASAGTPEKILTHCDARVDVNCVSTVTPATDPSVTMLPTVLVYEAKAILPDGSHAKLTCFPNHREKRCKMISSSLSNEDTGKCYMDAIAAFAANQTNETKICTAKNLGGYRVKRRGDVFVIYAPNGKLEYRIAGSW